MDDQPNINFDNSYAGLSDLFHARQQPTPVANPSLIKVNHALAQLLNIDPQWLESSEGVATIAGNRVPVGADPIATAYAGHQFGGWVPQLGDGRAILLGEVFGTDGNRYDVQLKGSGRTKFSRGGDGRSPLGPVVREYLVSEAMAALGIPTSRALAAVTTGEPVDRQDGPLPGGVLARVARSHIRIGTFQFLAGREEVDAIRQLVDYVIERHYPDIASPANPALELFQHVIGRQAELIARWQMVGFIHGVMNTDNMLVSGETIDYGPCAFMDVYDPATVFSSIDRRGRYAYGNQPSIAGWNLAQLAHALLPVIDDDSDAAVAAAQDAINAFPVQYQAAWLRGMLSKIGIEEAVDGDEELLGDLLTLMQEKESDFTLTFRALSDRVHPQSADGGGVRELFTFTDAWNPWLQRWSDRIGSGSRTGEEIQRSMNSVNPAFIPRNHLVEEAIAAAYEGNLQPFETLGEVLSRPFAYDARHAVFATPPRPEQVVCATFCGT